MKRPYPRTVVLFVSILVAAAIVAVDRMTKLWVMALTPNDHVLIPRLLALTHHQNAGLIADLPVPLFFIVGITGVVLIVIAVLCIRSICRQNLIESIAFACVVGGAIGNFWDRLTFGYVFDWLMFFNWSIMNIADIAIGCGILMLLIEMKIKRIEK